MVVHQVSICVLDWFLCIFVCLNYKFDTVLQKKKQKTKKWKTIEYLSVDENVVSMVKHFVDNKKPIAGICHAALLLAAVGAFKDKNATGLNQKTWKKTNQK